DRHLHPEAPRPRPHGSRGAHDDVVDRRRGRTRPRLGSRDGPIVLAVGESPRTSRRKEDHPRTSSLVTFAQQTEEHATQLPMPAWLYGVVAFAIFMLLLLFTLAYRNVHTRRR